MKYPPDHVLMTMLDGTLIWVPQQVIDERITGGWKLVDKMKVAELRAVTDVNHIRVAPDAKRSELLSAIHAIFNHEGPRE